MRSDGSYTPDELDRIFTVGAAEVPSYLAERYRRPSRHRKRPRLVTAVLCLVAATLASGIWAAAADDGDGSSEPAALELEVVRYQLDVDVPDDAGFTSSQIGDMFGALDVVITNLTDRTQMFTALSLSVVDRSGNELDHRILDERLALANEVEPRAQIRGRMYFAIPPRLAPGIDDGGDPKVEGLQIELR